MTLDESLQGMHLQLMRRAAEIGVSAACREAGSLADAVLSLAASAESLRRRWPGPATPQSPAGAGTAAGACGRAAAVGRGDRRSDVARGAARGLRPAPLAAAHCGEHNAAAAATPRSPTRRQRLLVVEHRSAAEAGLLTERTRRALWRLRHGTTRHVETEQPADLVCLDTLYIGKLKGVGKVWQITACDAASSFGVAGILPELSARAVAQFLRDILVPAVVRADWTVRRVPTDGGSEFKAQFDAACEALGIRHTFIRPLRLQQTIPTEHCVWCSNATNSRVAPRSPAASRLHAVLQLRSSASLLSSPHASDRLLRSRGGCAVSRSTPLWNDETVNTDPSLHTLDRSPTGRVGMRPFFSTGYAPLASPIRASVQDPAIYPDPAHGPAWTAGD